MNLRAMDTMRRRVRRPGRAVRPHARASTSPPPRSRWARELVEKHFTLDRGRAGPDHPFADRADGAGRDGRQIREVEAALGDGRKHGPTSEEREEMYAKARRSLIAADMPAGTLLTAT